MENSDTDAVWFCMRSDAGIELKQLPAQKLDQAKGWSMNIFKTTFCGPFELVYARKSFGMSEDDMVDFFNNINDFEDSDEIVYVGYVDEATGVFKYGYPGL